MRPSFFLVFVMAVAAACNETTAPGDRPGSWVTAAIGRYRTCGIATNGQTYCFGEATFGALGDGHAADSACVSNGFQKKENQIRGYTALIAFLDQYLKGAKKVAITP